MAETSPPGVAGLAVEQGGGKKTDKNPQQETGRPIGYEEEHSEFSFLWRRILTFTWIAVNSILIAIIIYQTKDPVTLKWIALGLIGSNVLVAILYMCGASAVDIGMIMKAVAKIKNLAGDKE